MSVPELERSPSGNARSGSWVILDDGRPVMETYHRPTAERYAARGCEVLTAFQWLVRFNRLVREAGGVQPSPEAMRAAANKTTVA